MARGYKRLLADHGLRFSRVERNVRVAEKAYEGDKIIVTASTFPNGKLRSIAIKVDANGYWRTYMRREALVLVEAIKHDKPELPITCSVVKYRYGHNKL